MLIHLIKKLEQRDRLTEAEREAIARLPVREELRLTGVDLVRLGDEPTHSSLLVEGFAYRYRDSAEGHRQVLALHVPGDFVDLQSFLLKEMDHSVGTYTACRFAMVPHADLRRVTEEHPHLTRMLWLSTLIDAAIHREWLLCMGRLQAAARLAHLLCEMHTRLKVVDLTDGLSFELPLTQAQLSDILGLSPVHVNRCVQTLRAEGLVVWDGTTITIKDWAALAWRGEFDLTYLHLENRPR